MKAINWNSSSGYPHFKRKREFRADLASLFTHIQRGSKISLPNLFTVATRRQVKNGKTDFGIRLFYMPGHVLTFVETYFGYNLTQSMKTSNESSVFVGKTQPQISKRLEAYRGKYVYSFDYSKFDQTVPRLVLLIGFEIIKCVLAKSLSHTNLRL